MPVFEGAYVRRYSHRSKDKHFRGAVLESRDKRGMVSRWNVVDRSFDRRDGVYIHTLARM